MATWKSRKGKIQDLLAHLTPPFSPVPHLNPYERHPYLYSWPYPSTPPCLENISHITAEVTMAPMAQPTKLWAGRGAWLALVMLQSAEIGTVYYVPSCIQKNQINRDFLFQPLDSLERQPIISFCILLGIISLSNKQLLWLFNIFIISFCIYYIQKLFVHSVQTLFGVPLDVAYLHY